MNATTIERYFSVLYVPLFTHYKMNSTQHSGLSTYHLPLDATLLIF